MLAYNGAHRHRAAGQGMTGKTETSRGFLARRRSRLWRYVSPGRRRLWTTVFVLLVGLFVAYGYFTSDGHVRSMVESELTRRLGRTVTVEHASFSLFGPVEIEGLTIASKDPAGPPALTARAAVFDHNPLTLLKGGFEPTGATFIGWKSTMEVDIGTTSRVTSGPTTRKKSRRRTTLPFDLFPIAVRDCTLRIVYKDGAKVVETREVGLDGALAPLAGDRYAIRLFGSLADGTAPAMTATLAVVDRDVEQLSLPVSVIKGIVPSALREQLDEWHVTGTLVLSRRPVGEDRKPAYDIDLGRLSAAVPASQIPLSFQDMQGHVLIDTSAERIALDGVACKLPQLGESARLVVEGSYDGFKADSPCNLQAHITSVELPPATGKGEVEEIIAAVRRTYGARGPSDTHITYARSAGEKAKFRGRVVLGQGVSGQCEFFPFRLDDMSGAIEFTDDQISLIDLKGTHGKAVVTVVGSVPDMSRYALYDIKITGTDVALDEALHYALDKSVGEFIWRDIQPRPGGRANTVVRVSRTSHDDRAPRIDVAIGLDGRAGIAHTAFPYALDKLRGKVVIDPTSVRIDAAGVHGQTQCTVRGAVTGIDTSEPQTDLTIYASDIAMDQALLKALGPEAAEALGDLAVSGSARSAKVHVTHRGAKGDLDYDVTAVLADVTAKPSVFPYELTDVAGRVRVTPEHVVLDDLVGRHGKTTMTVGGKVLLTDQATAVERLVFTARDLELDDDLYKALPEEVREVWRDLAPGGSANITKGLLRHKDLAGPDELDYEIVIEPAGARVTYAGFPRTVTGITGRIHAVPGLVTLTGVRATEGEMTVALDGRVVAGKTNGAKFALSAGGVPVDKDLIAAMRKVAAKQALHIKPGGTISVALKTLCFGDLCPGPVAAGPARPAGAAAPRRWSATGEVSFKDMGVDLGLASKMLTGQFTGSGAGRGDELEMDANLDLDEVLAGAQKITALRGQLLKHRDSTTLQVRDFEARAHGGKLAGKASIDLGDPVKYGVSLQVRGIDLAQMPQGNGAGGEGPKVAAGADEGNAPGAGAGEPADGEGKKKEPQVKGLLSGRLEMLAINGQVDKRRGAGEIHITDANISRLPVLMELLHLVQLHLPGKTSFSKADVVYRLSGETLIFKEIDLDSSVLSLVGSGTLDLKTGKIRMIFVGRRFGPLLRLDTLLGPLGMKLFKDAANQFLQIRVTGTLAKTKTETIPLPSVRNFQKTLRDILRPQPIEGPPR